MSRIAYVAPNRQIHLVEPDGRSSGLTDAADGLIWASWVSAGQARYAHTWPGFSPSGDRVACFRLREGGNASVLVSSLDGITSSEVLDLPDQVPIYLQWSVDGERLAAVSQSGEDLLLTVGRTASVSSQKILAKGSPLFFTWTPDGRLATFIGGGSANARMMIMDPDMRRPTEVLPGTPGDFCAPVTAGDSVLYGVHAGGRAEIVRVRGEGDAQHLPGGEGLLAFVASPDGRSLARAVAPGGDGSPYQGLSILDLESGTERLISDMTCLAFMWVPDGSGLVVARVDSDRGLVEWYFIDTDGTARHVADLLPTRDFRFYLRFFEQYTQSHPIVDPDSRHLLLAGVLRGQIQGARIWKCPLHGGAPREVAEGQFATFSPPISN
ncbi:MAG: hypothetical protein R3F61_33620 [Myxococcota bacterium]